MGRGRVTGNGSRAGEMARHAFRGFAGGVCAGQFAGGGRVLDDLSPLGLAGNVLPWGIARAADPLYSRKGEGEPGLEECGSCPDELAGLFPVGESELEKA